VDTYRDEVRQELARCRGRMGRILHYMSYSGGATPSSLSAPYSVFHIRPVKPLVVGKYSLMGTEICIPTDTLIQECFRSLILENRTSQEEFVDALSRNAFSKSTAEELLTKWRHFQLSGHMQA
jgi:hypothetical protein